MMKVVTACLCLLLLAPAGAAQSKKVRRAAGPLTPTAARVRRVLENIARAIEVYEDTRSLTSVRQNIRNAERDIDFLRMNAWWQIDSDFLNDLQIAHDSLTNAETFFKMRGKHVPGEEGMVIAEMAWMYECADKDAKGAYTGSFVADKCARAAVNEAKALHRRALVFAANAGFYKP